MALFSLIKWDLLEPEHIINVRKYFSGSQNNGTVCIRFDCFIYLYTHCMYTSSLYTLRIGWKLRFIFIFFILSSWKTFNFVPSVAHYGNHKLVFAEKKYIKIH